MFESCLHFYQAALLKAKAKSLSPNVPQRLAKLYTVFIRLFQNGIHA
jgi:hypothetical protein